MKKLFGIILFLFFCRTATAQIVLALLFGDKLNTGKLEFGLVTSPTWTNITGINGDTRSGFNLGIYFNIKPDNRFFLHIEGIGKGTFGSEHIPVYAIENDTLNSLFADGSVERKVQSFSMPVLVRYRINPHFFAEAGIQPNMRLNAKDIFSAKVNDSYLDYTIKTTDQFTLLDFGVAGGLFYKFRKDKRSMGMGIRYFQGLTDTYKTKDGNQVNTAWVLNITIPIGTGKSNAAAAGQTNTSQKMISNAAAASPDM